VLGSFVVDLSIVVDFTTSTTGATLVAILDSPGLSALTPALSYCGLLSAADSILSKADSTTVSDIYPDIFPVIGKAVDIELAVTVGGVTAIGTTVSGATDIDTTVGDVAVVVTAVGGVTDIDTTVGKVPVDDTTFVGDSVIVSWACPGVWLGTSSKFDSTKRGSHVGAYALALTAVVHILFLISFGAGGELWPKESSGLGLSCSG